MISAILFDYFGVISSSDNWGIEQISESTLSATDNQLLQTWLSFRTEQAQKLHISTDELEERYRKAFVNRKLIAYILGLKQTYAVGVLSNANRAYARPIMEDLAIDHLFDHIVMSSEVGFTKPHPEIFEYALHKLGVLPHEAVLIDDGHRNIEGAQAVGLHAILFEDFETMQTNLEQMKQA